MRGIKAPSEKSQGEEEVELVVKTGLMVFAILEATYGIDIQFDRKAMAHCTLTARLSDEPVGEKLDLICAVVNARYERMTA